MAPFIIHGTMSSGNSYQIARDAKNQMERKNPKISGLDGLCIFEVNLAQGK